jgi:hypothetical protein
MGSLRNALFRKQMTVGRARGNRNPRSMVLLHPLVRLLPSQIPGVKTGCFQNSRYALQDARSVHGSRYLTPYSIRRVKSFT